MGYNFDPGRVAYELEQRARAHFMAKAIAENAAKERKRKRAVIMSSLIAQGSSAAAAEVAAMATPEYKQLMDEEHEAAMKSAVATSAYEGYRVWIDLLRTANATAREEMKMGGFQT